MSSRTYINTAAIRQQAETEERQRVFENTFRDRKQKQLEESRRIRRKITIVVIIVAIVVIIAVAVAIWLIIRSTTPAGTTTNTGGGAPTKTGVGGSCQLTTDCQPNLLCSGSKCTTLPQSTCTSSNTCPVGYVCSNGKCEGLVGATCNLNGDCNSQLQCKNQVCSTISCTTVTDCPNAANNHGACVNSICVGGYLDGCTDNTQCNSLLKCVNGVCSGFLNDPCTQTSDCMQPYICSSGKCVTQPCGTVLDCTNANTGVHNGTPRCDSNACTDALNTFCLQQAQCGDVTLAQCIPETVQAGRCLGRGGMSCTPIFGNAFCISNECVQNPVSLEWTCSCQTNADCISTLPNCVSAGTFNYCSV